MEKRDVNGFTCTYEDDGPAGDAAGATAIVLLHGFPLDNRVWTQVAHRLADRHRVVNVNLRGFGTLTSAEAFTMNSLAEDVYALLTDLEALPCVLCGLSMGGYVALSFAKRWPSHLAGLALVDTRAEADDEAGRAARTATLDSVRNRGTRPSIDKMLPKLLAPGADDDVRESILRMMLDVPARTFEHGTRAMRDREDQSDLLAELEMPTAVVVGEHDAITPPATARRMVAAIPGAELTVVPDAGHLSPMDNPDAVAEAIGPLARKTLSS